MFILLGCKVFPHEQKKRNIFFKMPKTAQSFILSWIEKKTVDNKVKSDE